MNFKMNDLDEILIYATPCGSLKRIRAAKKKMRKAALKANKRSLWKRQLSAERGANNRKY